MSDSVWPLVDAAFLMVASLPVAILAFLWAISARNRAPRWVYFSSKWTTIVLFVPWLAIALGLLSDMAGGS